MNNIRNQMILEKCIEAIDKLSVKMNAMEAGIEVMTKEYLSISQKLLKMEKRLSDLEASNVPIRALGKIA